MWQCVCGIKFNYVITYLDVITWKLETRKHILLYIKTILYYKHAVMQKSIRFNVCYFNNMLWPKRCIYRDNTKLQLQAKIYDKVLN